MDRATGPVLSPCVQTLENGLTVVWEQLPHVHSVSIGVWIRTGSAHETPEEAGISHFLEHLLFKGTEKRTARQLMDAIESKGGQMNAFTSREYTCLYARTLDRHIDTAIEILGDIVKHSTFCDWEKERNVIIEEIASSQDVPDELIHDLLYGYSWPDHPLGRPIAGYERTVSQTGDDAVRAYMDRRYRADNMYVSVAGNFDPGVVCRMIEDEFGALNGEVSGGERTEPSFHQGVELTESAIGQHHLACAFPGASITAENRYRFDMLSSTLGGGSTSRLFESIREEAGLAYSIYAFHSSYADSGLLGIYAAVAPENLDRTLDLASAELRKLKDEPVPEDEVFSNREQLKGGLVLALENTFNRMARMAQSLMFYGRVITVEEVLEKVDAIGAEDMQRLAQELFTEDRCAMTILGPAAPETKPLQL